MVAALPAASPASFCSSSIARDYERPLQGLPAANPLPESLLFGPPAVKATVPRSPGERLIFQGAEPGFQIANQGWPAVELNWVIRVRVSRPDAFGSAAIPVSETVMTVGSLGPRELLPIGGEPIAELGTFRVDLVFLDQGGNVLGEYFEYIQVVPFKVRARMRPERRVVAPGRRLRLRVENLGTASVGVEEGYQLQRFEDGRWERAPQQENFFAVLRILRLGQAHCQSIRIFRSAKPGFYRIRKSIHLRTDQRDQRERVLIETFRVKQRAGRQ